MASTVRTTDYYYIVVSDKAGEGSRLLSGLKKQNVNLLAFCGFPVQGGKAQLDFVPEDPEAFRRAEEALGLKPSERKRALIIQGEDRAGAAAEIYQKLADKAINVTASQAIADGVGRFGMILWVKPADLDKAAKALGA